MKWIDRTFDFSSTAELAPQLMERLRGTPARLEELTEGLDAELVTRRDGDHWSIQENVGHLLSAEGLFLGRLDDFDAGVATLRAADLSGRRTDRWE